MKAILKLLIAAAVIHACFRGGQAAWSYYQFKDATQQAILFGAGQTTAQLHDQIVRRAQEYSLPVAPESVDVTRDGPRTIAAVSYIQPIELLPNYRRPFTFSFKVDALAVNPAAAGGPPN